MKFNRLLFLIISLGGLLLYYSCRKVDTVRQDTPHSVGNLENKFFNSHRSADIKEKVIVDFIKRKNDKEHFVEKTIKQIGFPRWDKTLSFTKADTKNAGRGNSEDSVSIFYVPFVRDSQNFVNSSLIIKAYPNDTTFYYICDWQYQNRVHGSPAIDTTAERYAIFFMILDNRTFGYTEFNITDSDLFPSSVPFTGETKKLGFVNITSPTAGRNSLLSYVEICVDFYVCGDPNGSIYGVCSNGCDYLNCAAGTGQPGHCYLVSSICDGWWEETGGGGGGGGGTGGTGGSGGGGGSNPPGDEPPPCDDGGLSGRNYDPCGGGWTPIPIDDEPGGGSTPPNDTTIANNLKKLIEKAQNKPDSVHAAAQQNGNERTFTFIRTPSNDTVPMWVREGTSHSSSPTLTSYSFAILHTHQEDDLTAVYYKNECFDGPDIYKLYKNVTIDGYPIEVSIVTTRDYYYAAVITDAVKFRDYIRSICGSQNLEEIYQQLSYKHSDAMDGCTTMPLCNWQKKTELGVLSITANNNSSVSGIKIFRSPKQSLNFTLLTP